MLAYIFKCVCVDILFAFRCTQHSSHRVAVGVCIFALGRFVDSKSPTGILMMESIVCLFVCVRTHSTSCDKRTHIHMMDERFVGGFVGGYFWI